MTTYRNLCINYIMQIDTHIQNENLYCAGVALAHLENIIRNRSNLDIEIKNLRGDAF